MGRLDIYKIDLKGMQAASMKYEFELDDLFFADIEAPEVQHGELKVTLLVKKLSHAFDLNFHTEGRVWVPCDRCLEDMELPIVSDDVLCVKFGATYSEEGDNLVVVPESEGFIDVAWFIYECIALAIPMRHVHAPGECNEAMNSQLDKYLRVEADDEETDVKETTEKPIDPRWNELRKILDNN